MSPKASRLFLLAIWLSTSLASPLMIAQTVSASDNMEADPQEWEQLVAKDARGDVLLHWPGTIDLFYLVVGEVYTFSLGETYLFLRLGYNVTEDGEEDIEEDTIPDPGPLGLLAPALPSDSPFMSITISFNTSRGSANLTFIRAGFGADSQWITASGPLVFERDGEHQKELMFMTSLRRFGLAPGDIMRDFQVTASRDGGRTDRMSGFDALTEFPVPPSLTGPEATGARGVPVGLPEPSAVTRWATNVDPSDPTAQARERPGADPQRAIDDPSSGDAEQHDHVVREGQRNILVRWDKDVAEADLRNVGFVNVTVENMFQRTEQVTGILVSWDRQANWLVGLGPGSAGGVKTLEPGGRVDFSIIAAPRSHLSERVLEVTFVVISSFGSLETRIVRFINTAAPPEQPGPPDLGEPPLPTHVVVTLLNDKDPFRVNEPRKIMVAIQAADGRYAPPMDSVRVFIHRVDERRPEQPYAMQEMVGMGGVYEIGMTFNRPGAWVLDVTLYDYAPDAAGNYPSIDFIVRVQHPVQPPAIVPVPLAVGGLGLGMGALMVKEQLAKKR